MATRPLAVSAALSSALPVALPTGNNKTVAARVLPIQGPASLLHLLAYLRVPVSAGHGRGGVGRVRSGQEPDRPPMVTSEKIWRWPIDYRVVVPLLIALVFATIAIFSATTLAFRHVRRGWSRSGTLALDTWTMYRIGFIMAVPGLALTGIMGVLLPESSAIWRFLGAWISAANFFRMPDFLLSFAGGRQHVQLILKQSTSKLPPVALYTQRPCCCMSFCSTPKQPEMLDVLYLRLMVFQLCIVHPLIVLLEVVLEMEAAKGAQFAQPALAVMNFLAVLKLPTSLICAAAVKGLVLLVGVINKHAAKAVEHYQISEVHSYCSRFLTFLNIIPLLTELLVQFSFELRGGHLLPRQSVCNIAGAFTFCVGSYVCARAASRAFPVPDSDIIEGNLGKSAVLRSVTKCPMCGSGRLSVMENSEEESLECASCKASGIPAVVEVLVGDEGSTPTCCAGRLFLRKS